MGNKKTIIIMSSLIVHKYILEILKNYMKNSKKNVHHSYI